MNLVTLQSTASVKEIFTFDSAQDVHVGRVLLAAVPEIDTGALAELITVGSSQSVTINVCLD